MLPATSRRALLQAAAALAVTPAYALAPVTLKLRLLETSDLHTFVEDYDYYRDEKDETVGLTKIATLVQSARASAKNSMLFDNGDTIQGNPLADFVAQHGNFPADGIHPIIRAMNTMGYDAATLGNHEFNYGLPLLQKALHGANFPYCSANFLDESGAPHLPPTLILERDFVAADGSSHRLKIGIIGFLPPQITLWDRAHLQGQARSADIVEAAQKYIPGLRQQVDLLFALSHSGISTAPRLGNDENASFYLSQIPGIDAIFTGHSHKVFPGPDFASGNGVDSNRGTLNGVPAVMPGFWGSELGIIDLTLTQTDGKWIVTDFSISTQPIASRQGAEITSLAANNAKVDAAVAPEHQKTLAWIREPIGKLSHPVNSYAALISGADSSLALVNAAQIWYATPLLPEDFCSLPVLSAAAPFKEGYHSPDNYVDLAAGTITIKDVAALYMYPNTIAAVCVTGADLTEWLERSACIFNRIDQGNPAPQPLLNPHVPSYTFDVISGITYQIDITQPARRGVHKDAKRILNLAYKDVPVGPAQKFVVITNNYRADSAFTGDPAAVVLRAPDQVRDILTRYILGQSEISVATPNIWSFAHIGAPVTLSFESAPAAAPFLRRLPGVSVLGDAGDGYTAYALQLDRTRQAAAFLQQRAKKPCLHIFALWPRRNLSIKLHEDSPRKNQGIPSGRCFPPVVECIILRKLLAALGFCGSLFMAPAAQAGSVTPAGSWLTADHSAVIVIAPCGTGLCGYIAGIRLDHPTDPQPRDWRGQPQCGDLIIAALPAEDNPYKWRGTVTDPRNGSVYRATLTLHDDGTLRLRGYVGVPLFGETQSWTRYTGQIRTGCLITTEE
jgi:2',3'-cyclic-nucleotide 2'-phosphodiesterase / 3'-nucleotidase